MTRDEGGGVGVLRLSRRVCLLGIGEFVRVGSGVAIKGASTQVIPRNVGVEGG